MRTILKHEASAFVLACMMAVAVAMLVYPIEQHFHRNDIISVYSSIGGHIFATNQMTLSEYKRRLAQGLTLSKTLDDWGNPMLIPTNISKMYDHNF